MKEEIKSKFEAMLSERFKPTPDNPLIFCIHTSCMLSDVYELMSVAYNLAIDDASESAMVLQAGPSHQVDKQSILDLKIT